MSLILKLEAMAGDNISQTCYQMVSIARSLDIVVEVKFNEVTLVSYYGGDPEELALEYFEMVSQPVKCKFVSTHGGKK